MLVLVLVVVGTSRRDAGAAGRRGVDVVADVVAGALVSWIKPWGGEPRATAEHVRNGPWQVTSLESCEKR